MSLQSICMLVTSELDHDPRVQKEAMTAHKAGYHVVVICRSCTGAMLPYQVVPLNVKRQSTRLLKYLERLGTNVKLIRLTLAYRPQIIHANDLDTLPAGFIASRLGGAKLLYDAHELWSRAGRDVDPFGLKILFQVEKFICRRADAVITVSDSIAQFMSETMGIVKPLVVMNAVPFTCTSKLPAGEWVQIFKGKKIVLFQGQYVKGRGLPEMIRMAKHFPDTIALVCRGYGPIEDQLREIVEAEGLSDRVAFLPPVPMNEMVTSAVGADVGVNTYNPECSLNQLYGLPNKVFEYMMAGVPCVSTDVPEVRKILWGLGIGDVCKPDDPEDMARVILNLLEDTERLNQLKRQCFEAANQLSWERQGEKLLQEYERITQTK